MGNDGLLQTNTRIVSVDAKSQKSRIAYLLSFSIIYKINILLNKCKYTTIYQLFMQKLKKKVANVFSLYCNHRI